MARLRSNRRKNRLLSRGLVGVLIIACALFGIYAFNPLGTSEAAESQPAEPQQTAAKPAGDTNEWISTDKSPALPNVPGHTPAPQKITPSTPKPADAPKPKVAAKPGFLADAKTLTDAGKLLEARTVLNDALQTGSLDSITAEDVKARIRELNQVIIFTPTKRFKDDPFQGEYIVQAGDTLGKIARTLDVPYQFVARVNAVKPTNIRPGQSLKIVDGPIHAVVNKKTFKMDLYLGALPGQPGSVYLTTFSVGLGADSSTPTGIWEVTRGSKLVNPEWTNPRTNEVYGRDDPKNPLGERWIGLTGIAGNALGQPSYGIHGTIEPETIGTNASMGCIRLADADIEAVYDMLVEGKSTIRVVAE